jgi:anti-anti-sigma factor
MSIEVTREQGRVPVTVLHPKGELDAVLSEELRVDGRAAIEAGNHHILLDLAGVPYIASAGLRVFQELFNLLRKVANGPGEAEVRQGVRDGSYKSPHLKLLNPTRSAMEAISTAGFDMFLEIHRDLQEAVASF